MAVISGSELRRLNAERLEVKIPGSEKVLLCRAIDPLSLVFNGDLKTAVMEPAIAVMASWAGMSPDQVLQSMVAHADVVAPVIDAILCAAGVEPRITSEKPAESDDAAVWIADLSLSTKAAILFAVTAHLDQAPAPQPVTVG